jgi:hypothetical protein
MVKLNLHHFFILKIYIYMVYKQKVLELLSTLDAKLRLIENVSTGAMKMSNDEVGTLVNQTKKIRDQIENLISIERE